MPPPCPPPPNNKGGAGIPKEALTVSPGLGAQLLGCVHGSHCTCHLQPDTLTSSNTNSPRSALFPLARCPPPHPRPHPLGVGCWASAPRGLGVERAGCQNGPGGRAGATCSSPSPDTSPAVALPLSATSPSSSWLGSCPLSCHPPTYPTHRPSAELCCRPPPHCTQPLAPLGAGSIGPRERGRWCR